MRRRRKPEFYYQAAAYSDVDLSSEVFQTLDSLTRAIDYNLSVCRYKIDNPRLYCVVVVGKEEPRLSLDETIYEYLNNTGEIIGMSEDTLRDLLTQQTNLN